MSTTDISGHRVTFNLTPLHAFVGEGQEDCTHTMWRIAKAMPTGIYTTENCNCDEPRPITECLEYLEGPDAAQLNLTVLIEQPEVNFYPTNIPALMRRIRKLSESRQVLMWTNSPFILNEMDAHEVTLVSKANGRMNWTRFCDMPGSEDDLKVFELGEFWCSYCVGGAEVPLLEGKPRLRTYETREPSVNPDGPGHTVHPCPLCNGGGKVEEDMFVGDDVVSVETIACPRCGVSP